MEKLETIKKPTKKVYQKHKTDKKISIVHFLNKKVKPIIIDSEPYYPLYIRITKERKNTTIKSLIWGYFSKEMLNDVLVTHAFLLEQNYILHMLVNAFHTYNKESNTIFSEFTSAYRKNSNVLKDTIYKHQIKVHLEPFKKFLINQHESINEGNFNEPLYNDLLLKTFRDLENEPKFFLLYSMPLIVKFFKEMINYMTFSESIIEIIINKTDTSDQKDNNLKNVG